MRDEAHVGLVDAHAEGDRRHDDHAVVTAEALLRRSAHVVGQPRVVGDRVVTLAAQQLGDLVGALARLAVDDAGRPAEAIAVVAGLEEAQQLGARVALLLDDVADVGPIEARHELRRVVEPQPLVDLAAGQRVGGGGEGDARHAREVRGDIGDPQVLRAEVVAPLRHAVRLVDREQRDAGAGRGVVEEREERRHEQALGRDVEQVELAREQVSAYGARFLGGRGRVPERGAHTEQPQRLDLVVHERDERRDDDADAGPHQRRQLVAQRLAAAGRHQHHGVVAGDHALDDRLLRTAERAESEHLAQHPRRRVEGVARHLEAGRGDREPACGPLLLHDPVTVPGGPDGTTRRRSSNRTSRSRRSAGVPHRAVTG